MADTIIILGKATVRATEVPDLEVFGTAMAKRGKTLITKKDESGACAIVARAYIAAGGTPIYLDNTNYKELIDKHPVIAITDTKYANQLDKAQPGWRKNGWEIIHNPKALNEAAAFLKQLMADLGTPIEESP